MQYRNVLETLSKAVLDRDAQSQKNITLERRLLGRRLLGLTI